MPAVAVDTHAIVWYLANDTRLSSTASEFRIWLPQPATRFTSNSICLVELGSLLRTLPRNAD